MPDIVAKAMAVMTGMLLVMTLAILYVTSRPPAGTQQIVAEFRDAFPAIEGMQVRTDGAVSGSTGKISVTDSGLASVTLLVENDIPEPKADAVAVIKQLDSTGDSYIQYDPGTASEPLAGRDGKPTISCAAPTPTSPCTNTLAAPRFDDLINAFGPPEQAGVKLILQNLSKAVDERGDDVNRAALRLVPALDAANRALDEVNGQNAALKSLITDLEAVTGQAAARDEELGNLIGSLDRTLTATAAAARPLDAGLEKLPETESQIRSVLASLTRAADGTRPLAAQLAKGAPRLSRLLDRAPGFIDDVRGALRQGRPTLDLTRKLLVDGAPTIEADPQRVVTGAFDLAPALSNLLKGILGGDDTIKAFFGDERNGAPEDRPGFGFGLGAIASEPGDQAGYPADWADRNFIRVGGVLNCQTFGIPIGPGCLATALAERKRSERSTRRKPKPVLPPRRPSRAPPAPEALAPPVREALEEARDRGADSVTNLLDYLLR